MQFNSIVMAMAGAERIFQLMDEPTEVDNGYVLLVNAKEENGKGLPRAPAAQATGHGSIPTSGVTAPSIIRNCAVMSSLTVWTSAIRTIKSCSTT